jgi:hypothetical protein
MDDTTRRHWEQIADATIDRAIAAAMGELKASQPELEDTADTWGGGVRMGAKAVRLARLNTA